MELLYAYDMVVLKLTSGLSDETMKGCEITSISVDNLMESFDNECGQIFIDALASKDPLTFLFHGTVDAGVPIGFGGAALMR